MSKGLSFSAQATCNSYKQKQFTVVDEGGPLGTSTGYTEDECKTKCTEKDGCQSFRYCPDSKKCFFKDKKISESSQENSNTVCFTVYQDCENGI